MNAKQWAKVAHEKTNLAIGYIKSNDLILAEAELWCVRGYLEEINRELKGSLKQKPSEVSEDVFKVYDGQRKKLVQEFYGAENW